MLSMFTNIYEKLAISLLIISLIIAIIQWCIISSLESQLNINFKSQINEMNITQQLDEFFINNGDDD
jgi:ABC-type transport system involved in multi-copper enzyme maturation permease subunit